MAIEAGCFVECQIKRCPELVDRVGCHIGRRKCIGEFELERQGHVESVQPDLMRIAQLVPVWSRLGAGVMLQLQAERPSRVEVACFAGRAVEVDQRTSGQHIVDVEFINPVSGKCAVRSDLAVDETGQMLEPAGFSCRLVQADQAAIEAAVLVAPGATFVIIIVAGVIVEIGGQHGFSQVRVNGMW